MPQLFFRSLLEHFRDAGGERFFLDRCGFLGGHAFLSSRSLSDIAFVTRRRRCGQMRGRRPEADPRFTFHASRFTVLGSGLRTTQMVADRLPQ